MFSVNRLFRLTVLGTLALTLQSAFADDQNAKLAIGSHDAELSDVSLHYVVSGQGPLVVVTSPGWGIGSLYLQRGLAPLEENFTLLFLDTRGSGESSRPADIKQMSSAVMADDIDHLRAYLGIDSIDLVGHSNGGAIALDYAERYPQRVKKLVLIDAEVQDDRDSAAIHRYLALWHDDPKFKTAIQALPDDTADGTDEQFDSYFEKIAPLYFSDPNRYLPLFEEQYRGTHLSSFASRTQALADKLAARHQSLEYHEVRAKTLIISGTIDFICPVEVSERMHRHIAGSSLSLYANVAHFPYIEQPARFFSEVSQFLGENN
jgi:proline iminopeptidase